MATQSDEILKDTDKAMKFSDVVNFEMKYPSDFKKKKHYKDGDVIELHLLQAKDFEARGLGKIKK
jgi:hypothetical protein